MIIMKNRLNNIARKVRILLSNKWIVLLYPIFITVLVISYIRCRYSPHHGINSVKEKNEHVLRRDAADKVRSYIFIFIMTSPGGFTRRKAMRETWLQPKSTHSVVINWKFIIGTGNLSTVKIKELQTEQNNYRDLLFLTEYEDSYKSLTTKLLKSLIWINENVQAKFVLKADDDTFVRLDVLINDMKKREHMKRLYWGYFRGNSNVKRVGKWSEKSWFLSDHYLPYALGGGYILTMDLIDYISSASDYLQKYNSEDASLGVWLAPVQLNRIHDVRFDTEYRSRGCSNDHVISHKQNEEDMYEKHNQLLHYHKLCKEEKELMFVFDYDWKVPPSQCCKRVPRTALKVE